MNDHTVILSNRNAIRLYDDGSVMISEFDHKSQHRHSIALDANEAIAIARAILKHFGEGLE